MSTINQWIDGVKQDLEKLEILNWKEKIQNREEWKSVSVLSVV